MKVDLSLNRPNIKSNQSFAGYSINKSEYGEREYEFSFPYDDEKYDCYLEVFSVDNIDGNYVIDDIIEPLSQSNNNSGEKGIKLKSGTGTKIDLAEEFGIQDGEAFGYHYKFYPKGTHDRPSYQVDAGNVVNNTQKGAHEVYNIVTDRVATSTKGGSMKLIHPDITNVAWVYNDKNEIVPNPNEKQARKTIKIFSNKLGGSLAGIEKELDEGKLDNFTRIVTTPLFTDDSVSSHAYWNKNNFQMAHSLGNINNYISLQKKLFAKGINLVSDGAYVNEGLEGVHFQHVLHWGEQSPYFNWFKISAMDNAPLSLGVFGKKINHVTHRLVNSPYEFIESNGNIKIKNKKYDHKKPTYIQIYDDRLVNAESLSDKDLIKAYNKLHEHKLDINNHDDTVVPYSFRINPETYKKNVLELNEHNKNSDEKISMYSGIGTMALTKFEYFGLDGKHESGFETWDANTDIPKLNFVPSHADTQNLKNIVSPEKRKEMRSLLERKHAEVQDYAVSSGKYWTKKTNDILLLNAAQHLKNIGEMPTDEIFRTIKSQANGKVFPKNLDITQKIVDNVIYGDYNLKGANSEESYNDIVLRGLMDVPLDSIELGDDIVGVLASPMITKRASNEDEIGVSRFDLYKKGNPHVYPKYSKVYEAADKIYTVELNNLAQNVLKTINNKLPEGSKLYENSENATSFGKYAIPLLTAEIARFAVLKSVIPDLKYTVNKETGEIAYDYKTSKSSSLLGMGVFAHTPEDEASQVVNKIRKGINKISNDDKSKLATALYKSIKDLDYESFALAETIVSRAQAGLDWRIDATKDIGDMESLKNRKTDFENTWDLIIKFWSKFTENIKEIYPDAYIAAEVTDEGQVYSAGNGYKSGARYEASNDSEGGRNAIKKLLNEAGFTTIANYPYFSSAINQIFGKLFDFDGENDPDKGPFQDSTVLSQLGAFLSSAPLEGLLYSYTFAGNHDKCRALEGYAMDMSLVYSDLTNKDDYNHRKRAYKVLHAMPYGKEPSAEQVNKFDYNRISSLAIAKSEAIASGMGKAKENINASQERKDYIYDYMLKALANLSNSKFKGRIFEGNGFGAKNYSTAIDVVFDEMDYLESDKTKRLTEDEKIALKKATLKEILEPAMSRLLAQTEFLTALPGNPTLFGGDEYGSTGYEYTTKNITLQNRNKTNEEWADETDPDYMPFVKEYNKKMHDIFKIRQEVEPLNNGAPFALGLQDGKHNGNHKQFSAILRQSPDGKLAISVFNTAGINHNDFDKVYNPERVVIDKLKLGTQGANGLGKGLRQGLKFVNARNKSEVYYTRYNKDDGYYLVGHNPQNGTDHPIVIDGATLVLYRDPHDPSFTGRSKTLYNPKFNIVSNPYSNNKQAEIGSRLLLTSK